VDFTGQRVGVIGTGSSAIQSIPIIAAQAAHLFVFQRTPNFSVPAHNAPLDPEYERTVKASYAEFRRQARESRVGFVVERNDKSALEVSDEERTREYEARFNRCGLGFSSTFNDLLISKDANDTAAEFFRAKIRSIVRDPEVARRCASTIPSAPTPVRRHQHATFNRQRHPRRSPEDAHRDDHPSCAPASGPYPREHRRLPTPCCSLLAMDIRGRDGQTLKTSGRKARRPRVVAASRTSPSPVGQPLRAEQHDYVSIAEQHADWIADCIAGPARALSHAHRGHRRPEALRNTSMGAPSIRRRTPGTWGRTSPASRACSCRTLAVWACIGRSVMRLPLRVMRDFS
jgi:cyclohexanone monooxygenase